MMVDQKIPSGYKSSSLGPIPSDWELLSLGEVVDKNIKWSFTGGPFGSNLMSKDYTEDGIRIIQLQNIGDGEFLDDYKIYTSKAKADELLSCNIYPSEIILSKMGDPVARACIIPETEDRFLMASDGIRLSPDKKRYNNLFLLNYINFDVFRNEAKKASTGSTRQRIGLDDLKSLKIIAPKLEEQTAIANLLSTWDEAILKVSKLIEQYEKRHKIVINDLITGKRRAVFSNSSWDECKFGDFLHEDRTKGSSGESARKLTVKLYGKGVIAKNESSIGSQNTHYYTRKKGQFIYGKLDFLNGAFGIIPEELDDYESTLDLPAFNIDTNKILPLFLISYVCRENFYNKYEGGAIGGRKARRIQVSEFSRIKLLLPKIEEQEKIVKIIQRSDQEIQFLRLKLEKFKEQKKGLMQQLLTGKKRLTF